MLTQEDDVEIHALAARGWSVSAISRHTGRDRKTIRRYLAGQGAGQRRERAPSCLEPFRTYIQARFTDDPHMDATVLFRELVDAGFDRSYPTLVRELRRLELRPVCLVCQHRRGRAVTVEIEHPPGEEIQWDWLELDQTPWGEPAFVLVGALSASGRFRGVFCEQMTFGHLAEAMHRVLAELGGTPQIWRTDRMATIVDPRDRPVDRRRRTGGQALRHRDHRLPATPRAAQGCRRGRDQVPDSFLVAQRARSDDGRGAALAGPVERRGRRPAPRTRRDGRPARRGGAAASIAGGCLPRADRRRAQGLTVSAGRLRGQPLQRRPRPRRPHAHGPGSRQRADLADRHCGGRDRCEAPSRSGGHRADWSAAPSTLPCSKKRCSPRLRPITPADARSTGRPARARSPNSRA